MCQKNLFNNVWIFKDGDFLVRESQGSRGQYVLTGMQSNSKKHLLLVDPEGVVRKHAFGIILWIPSKLWIIFRFAPKTELLNQYHTSSTTTGITTCPSFRRNRRFGSKLPSTREDKCQSWLMIRSNTFKTLIVLKPCLSVVSSSIDVNPSKCEPKEKLRFRKTCNVQTNALNDLRMCWERIKKLRCPERKCFNRTQAP